LTDPATATAVVLAGGLGTRLRSVVADRPKVLAPVRGRPFLAYLLDQVAAAGIREAVLCTGYLGEDVRTAFGDAHADLRLIYSQESSPLGTAGALRQALPLVPESADTLLVLNGDSYCETDIRAFEAWHRARGAVASIALVEVADTRRYGRVQTDPDGRVVRFEEKGEAAGPGWINAGQYLLERRLVESVPAAPGGGAVSLEREVFPAWVGRGLCGHRSGGPFIDIGTPESYARAEAFFAGAGTRASASAGPGAGAGSRPRRAVVLDRDGTLIVERHYLSDPAEVELIPGVAAGLARLARLGLALVVITSQSGIERGYLTEARLEAIHARMRDLLGAEGAGVDAIYHCPHLPEAGCACRKPRTGLVERASRDLGFDPRAAFFVGDKACDIELGRAVGGTTFLVRTGYGAELAAEGPAAADHIVLDVGEAALEIERRLARNGTGALHAAQS